MSGISEAGEKPIGEHGTNYFYKEFMVSGSAFKNKKYQLGSFYFVRKSADFPVAIAEILLIWSSKNSDKKFASTKLYLKPEETNFYGKDELVVAERNVVVECHKFPLWECSPENWYTNTGEFLGTLPGQKPHNECVIKVLSFPQYCRYQAYKKLVDSGVKISEKMILALGGIKFDNQHVLVVFSRKSIQKENVTDFSPTQDVLVPQFRGRPRKRKNKCILQQENICKRRALISEENKNALSFKDEPEVKEVLPVLSPSTETNNDVMNQAASCTGVSSVSSKQSDTHKIVYPTDPNEFKSFLYEFMRNRGTPITKIPVIGYVKVNLFNLFSLVDIHGGYFEVTLKRQWRRVYELLGHCNTITNSATITRKAYENLLLPFESYLLSKTGLKVPEYLNGGKEILKDEKEIKDKNCKKNNLELQTNSSYACKPTHSLLLHNNDISHTAQKPNTLSVCFNSLTSSKIADPQNDAFKLVVLKSRGRPTKEFRTQIGQLCQSTQVDHDCPPLDNKSLVAISSLKTMEEKKYLGQTKKMLQPSTLHHYTACKNREFSSLDNTLSKRFEINTFEINEKHSLLEDNYNGTRFSSADDLDCEASVIPDCPIGTFRKNSLSNKKNLDLKNAQSSYGVVRPPQVSIHASANISSTWAAQTNETTCDGRSFVCGSSLKSKENNNLDERDLFYKSKSVYPFQQRHRKQAIELTKEHSQYRSVCSSYN